MNSTIISYLSQFNSHKKFIAFLSKQLDFNTTALIAFVVFLITSIIVVKIMTLVNDLNTYAERKISANIQIRQNPNRVNPFNLLQFLTNSMKIIMKEDVLPKNTDKLLFTITPLMTLISIFKSLTVIPFSSRFILTNLNINIFYLINISSLIGMAIFLGGYSSNSKQSMLNSMRNASQIISYEVPVTLSILAIVILADELSFNTLVNTQNSLPHQQYILHNPFTFIKFFVFFINTLAETNKTPFNLPKAESELISDYHTKYTEMRFEFFTLAEYIEVFIIYSITVAAFLNNYKVPFDLRTDDFLVNTLHLPPVIRKNIKQILQIKSFITKTLLLYYIVI